MKLNFRLTIAATIFFGSVHYGVAQSQLNSVRIGQCYSTSQIDTWKADEEKRGLVLDSRPFAINQSTGKLLFTRGPGRVSVLHMNPFVYDYKISVAQQELVSTALTDFLKLLLPQSLGQLPGLQSGEAGKRMTALPPDKIRLIEARLSTFSLAACNAAAGADQDAKAACAATNEMFVVFNQIRSSLQPAAIAASPLSVLETPLVNATAAAGGGVVGNADTVFAAYTDDLIKVRNEQLTTYETCNQAQQLNATLGGYDFDRYFNELNAAQKEISRVTSLVEDLEQLIASFNNDTKLKDRFARCNGFSCTNQFQEYTKAVRLILGAYQAKLTNLRQHGQEMRNLYVFTEQLKAKDGVFARTFEIIKKFELSQATISVRRTTLQQTQNAGTQSGTVNTSATTETVTVGSSSSEGTEGGPAFVPDKGGVQSGTPSATPSPSPAGSQPSGNALTGDVNEVVQLGRPRFMLSGGLVYSPLARRTFKTGKGFVLDAQGNPTGNGDANVVSYIQNSPRRLLPMVFLNSRLLDHDQGSLYFSFGVSAKKDDNVDLEYLLGPSVSFLNDRALFTFGAYGGMTQNLVGDVKIGDPVPDSLGDAKFYHKRMTWKPGFSFSYSFSRAKKGAGVAASGGPSTDDLRNEIRIGSIPFNFALGLAYTSLEQRVYDEIGGYARDRQGNLTNGKTLTRIVGVTSSSGYRLTPLAMLHSRLTNFGAHDFYFTAGITGKKTDNDFDVEYLLGGSVNVYRRKVFLTFGTFIGKQQLLSGNFFEGQALGKTQEVPTQNRYVWKPAISFSYDISRIIPVPR